MAKYQKGRFTENLAYGLPLMPVSDTHDGRIVYMQKRALEQDEKFQQITKYHQNDLTNKLSNLYGSNQVSFNEFTSKIDNVNSLLYEQNDILYNELSNVNTNLGEIKDVNKEGFSNVVNTISTEGFETRKTLNTGFRSVNVGLNDLSRNIVGPKRAITPIAKYMAVDDKNIEKLMSAYKQNYLNEDAKEELIDELRWKLNIKDKDVLEDYIVANAETNNLTKSDIAYIVNNNYATENFANLAKEHIREARKGSSLTDINFGMMELNNQIDISNNLLYNVGSEMSEANEHLINLEQLSQNFINVTSQGFYQLNNNVVSGFNSLNNNVKIGFTETIKTLDKGFENVSNQLEEIDDSLDTINENLISGFTTTNKNLIQLQKIVTMVGLKLIDEIQFWGQNILNEVNYTNQLLTKIIELKINSLKVEGKQRLEQGVFLLKLNDFEDALDSFKDGIKQDRTNQYLYFGAGISLEMQNQLKEAIEYYKKSASRAKGANELIFASVSMQKIARLYYYLKEYDNAISSLSLAIELNPKNITAKFELAKILTEEAKFNQSRKVIIELIKQENKFLKLIKQDNSFQTMPIEMVYKELVDQNIVTKENLMIVLLKDFLVLKNTKYALMINNSLINNGINYEYLKLRIWDNPAFDTIKTKFIYFLKEKNNKNSLISFRNQRYSASFLLYYLNFSVEEIANCFIEELNNDMNKLYQDKNLILERLLEIDKQNTKEFINKISSFLNNYKWLKN